MTDREPRITKRRRILAQRKAKSDEGRIGKMDFLRYARISCIINRRSLVAGTRYRKKTKVSDD